MASSARACGVGIAGDHASSASSLEDDDAHGVSDDVVHLARDAGPLLGHGGACLLAAFALEDRRPLLEDELAVSPLADGQASQPGTGEERERQDDVAGFLHPRAGAQDGQQDQPGHAARGQPARTGRASANRPSRWRP